MKLAAREMGSMKAVKDSLKKGGGNSAAWIKHIPAEGITVRFLTEPEAWFGYQEYYQPDAKAFVPMVEGEVLPDGSRASFRYLAVAVDIETDRVVPLKMPKTAANALILKYDKYGTLMDRDYELERFGEGLDTTYDVTPTAPSPFDISKYTVIDLEEVLVAARKDAIGESDVDSSSRDDDPFTAADLDDTDDTDDDSESQESSGEVDVDNLHLLSIRELKLIALEHDVDPRGKNKSDLVDAVVEALEA